MTDFNTRLLELMQRIDADNQRIKRKLDQLVPPSQTVTAEVERIRERQERKLKTKGAQK